MSLIPIIFLFVFCFYRYGVGISLLYLNASVVLVFGVVLDGDYSINSYLMSYLLSNVFLLLGFIFVKEWRKTGGVKPIKNPVVSVSYSAMTISFWFITMTTLLHYVIVGIPFLSGSFDEVRFLQANSGYLGIPSRFASYMPSIMMLVFVFYLFNREVPAWQRRIMMLLVFVVFLFQGHKSSVLQMILLAVIAYPYCEIKSQLRSNLKWFLVLSMIAGYYLFSKLATIQGFDLLTYLISRYSIIMHSSSEYLIEMEISDFTLFMNNPVINDLLYPLNKILSSGYETLNTQLSRKVYGVNEGDFSVPVTPGFFAYHYFSFGSYFEKIIAVLIGVVTGLLDDKSRLTQRPLIKLACCFFSYWIYIGYTSGNLYYLISNVIFCWVCFVCLYSIIANYLKLICERRST